MSIFDWLFGTPQPAPIAEDVPSRGLMALDRAQARFTSRPPEAPHHDRAVQIQYQADGQSAPTRRQIVPLFLGPDALLVAIDLGKTLVRTYRTDRISSIADSSTGDGLTLDALLDRNGLRKPSGSAYDSPQFVAAKMVQSMLPQLSILAMLARASTQGMDSAALDLIDSYIRRDARFAVRHDWVPTGSKADVWPLMRQHIANLHPERRFLAAYVRTLNADWENATRFGHFNEAAGNIGNRSPGPTRAQIDILEEINRHGG